MTRAIVVKRAGAPVVLAAGSALLSSMTAQALRAASLAENSATAAQAFTNFRQTRAEGIADFTVGQYFSSAETGALRVYKRIVGSPFYQDMGDAAAPLTKALLGGTGGAAVIGAAGGGTVQEALDTTLQPGKAFVSTFDESDPDAHGIQLNGEATGKDFDVLQTNFTIGAGQRGNGHHVMANALLGSLGGQAGGFAMNGLGLADSLVGNRYEGGQGSGVVGARVGTGLGNGVEGRASSTATCSAGYFIKQNPVSGTVGAGPAVWMLNDSVNGEAFYARSSAGNTDGNTGIVDRLNGTQGTALFVRITGGGARTTLVRGGATHVVPTVSSTGSAAVIGHDYQINSNVTGSSDVRALNIANAATGCTEAFGAVVLVDGANTTNYGLFINAANASNNHALYLAGGGLLSVGGNIRALNDGTQDIGTSSARFGSIFAANGTINTSDAREKKWLGEMSEAHLRAARRIGRMMGSYQWLDQIAEKGEDGARIHFGVKAQDVVEVFYEEGLEERPGKDGRPSFRHAFLCYDRWDDILEPVMVKREAMALEDDWVDTGETRLIKPDPYYVAVKGGKRKKLVRPKSYTVPVLSRQQVERLVTRYEQDGERVKQPAGDRYGLRLSEFALFLIAAQEARLAALEA